MERKLNSSDKLRERKIGYLAGMLGADPAFHLDHVGAVVAAPIFSVKKSIDCSSAPPFPQKQAFLGAS